VQSTKNQNVPEKLIDVQSVPEKDSKGLQISSRMIKSGCTPGQCEHASHVSYDDVGNEEMASSEDECKCVVYRIFL